MPTIRTQAPREAAATRALEFLRTMDGDRIGEKAYAERIFKEVEILRASSFYDGDMRAGLDLLKLYALWGMERQPEALVFADTIFARGAVEPEFHAVAFSVASSDPAKAIALLERSDRDLTAAEARASFYEALDEDAVSSVRRALFAKKDKAGGARLAEALLKFDWPGAKRPAQHDYQRLTAARGRLAKGDLAGAQALARQVTAPGAAIELFTEKAFDDVRGAEEPAARFAALLAAEEKRSISAYTAKADDLKQRLERAQFLRSVGRDQEAVALLGPHNGDMAKVEKGGADAFWLVNEEAFALTALGRPEEGIALLRRLVALGVDKHPDLINMAINLGGLMNRAGRHKEAVAHAEKLSRKGTKHASKFGVMFMWQEMACGHAMSGNIAAAKPWVDKMRVDPDANRAALLYSLLCTNDLDGAEAQVIERLNGDDASEMLVAMQDYTIPLRVPLDRLLDGRFQQVLARPAVAAALARKGRILALPLPRGFWGMF